MTPPEPESPPPVHCVLCGRPSMLAQEQPESPPPVGASRCSECGHALHLGGPWSCLTVVAHDGFDRAITCSCPVPVVAVAPPYWCGHDAHVPGDCPWAVAPQSVELDELWEMYDAAMWSGTPIETDISDARRAVEQAIAATAVAELQDEITKALDVLLADAPLLTQRALDAYRRLRALASPPPSSAPTEDSDG